MPLFYTHHIDAFTRLAIWHISEDEAFFLEAVPLGRAIAHPHKRLQHLAGRYLLQWLFPEFPVSLIQVADTRKPFLPSDSHHFSISHCGNYAAAIVSTTQRVGIDIEEPTDRLLRLMPKFLTEEERSLTVPHHTDQLIHLVTMLWSAKEAMYKWYSLGEIDFKEHLNIQAMAFQKPDEGIMTGAFQKFDPEVPLILPFKCWPNLLLTWTMK